MHDTERTRRWILRATGTAVAAAAIAGNASANEHIGTYEAELTDEAHGLDTGAGGRTTFEVDLDAEEVRYEIRIDTICDPNQAHIHLGGPEEDGPVVVWLYPEDEQQPRHIEGQFEGTLAEGTFTAEDFVGPFEGMSVEEALATKGEEGAYVNVHTEEHPGGEIRGQIEPVDPVETVEDPPEEEEEAPPEEDDESKDEPATTAEEADLRLGELNVGSGVDWRDEYITIQNVGDRTVDFDGWTLQDRRGEGIIGGTRSEPWHFPSSVVLEPGEEVRIYSGDGENTRTEWYIGYGNHVWRQTGDAVIVEDADGNVALEESYESRSSIRVVFSLIRALFL